MKKFYLLFATILLVAPSSLLGQNFEENIGNEIINEAEKSEETPEEYIDATDIDIVSDVEKLPTDEITQEDQGLQSIGTDNGLGLISFGFCNEGLDNLSSNLNYAVSQGSPFDICYVFTNGSNQDITVKVRIVGMTGGACDYNDSNFLNFVDQEDLSRATEITIPAGNYKMDNLKVTFPVGMGGDQSACFTFYIEGQPTDAMIVPIINRASFMHFFVGDLDNIKNEIQANDITTTLDDNKDLQMDFVLDNVGNLEDSITIKGQITNILGFKKDFEIEGKGIQLTPGSSVPVSAKLGSLPGYGGLFKIEFTVTATPFFSYDVSHSTIDPSLLEDKTFTVTTTYFQMPWLILIVLVLVIVILFLAFRKPKNKQQPQVVYVQVPQQPVSQPTQPQTPQQ